MQLEAAAFPTFTRPLPSRVHLLRLFSFWILLPVLLYFATRGNLLSKPSAIAGNYTSAANDDKTARGRIFVLGSWGIAGILMVSRRRTLLTAVQRNRSLLCLPLWALATILWSANPMETLHRGLFLLLSTVFALFLSKRFTPDQHLRLFYYVGIAAAVLSLACVVALPSYGIGPDAAWKGIFGHKNDLGVFMVFLASPAFFLPRQKGVAKFGRIAFLLLSLVLIVFSQSRTGWLVLIAYLAYYAASSVMRRFDRRTRLLILAATLLVAAIASILISSNYAALLELMGKDATLSDRTEIWKAVMASIAKKPILGYGYGAFWAGLLGPSADVIISIHFGIGHAHNGFLNTWLEMGLVGLGLLVFVLLRGARQTLGMAKWSAHLRWYAGILFLIVVSNFDESFLFNNNDLIWMLFILAAAQIAWLAKTERLQKPRALPLTWQT